VCPLSRVPPSLGCAIARLLWATHMCVGPLIHALGTITLSRQPTARAILLFR
jgi:hypothetical protein